MEQLLKECTKQYLSDRNTDILLVNYGRNTQNSGQVQMSLFSEHIIEVCYCTAKKLVQMQTLLIQKIVNAEISQRNVNTNEYIHTYTTK